MCTFLESHRLDGLLQIINLILPRKVNVRRKSAWYAKTGELPDLSPEDAQVCPRSRCSDTLGGWAC